MHMRDSRDFTRARSLLRIVFVTLTITFGLGATLLILLHYFVGERLGLVALLNNFLLLLLLPHCRLPSPVCCCAAGWRRYP
jgi:hypothetical protein